MKYKIGDNLQWKYVLNGKEEISPCRTIVGSDAANYKFDDGEIAGISWIDSGAGIPCGSTKSTETLLIVLVVLVAITLLAVLLRRK